jgi:hypothetical protein
VRNVHGTLAFDQQWCDWGEIDNGLTNTTVLSLGASPNGVGGMNLFAGTYGSGIFLSTNNGASWSEANSGLTDFVVTSFSVGGSKIYAGTLGGIFLSTNNGTSWTAVNNGLTNMYVFDIVSVPNGVGGVSLFAGTGGGVFLSTNNGTNWSPINTGLRYTWVYALAVSPDGQGGTNLLAGTAGGGVWKRPLSEIVTAVPISSQGLPTLFTLDQNYPNPFNPSTQIRFQIPARSAGGPDAGFVSLKVFDVLGRDVATLVNEELQPGSHTISFDASGLAGGMYFCSLTAENHTQVRKMVLMK